MKTYKGKPLHLCSFSELDAALTGVQNLEDEMAIRHELARRRRLTAAKDADEPRRFRDYNGVQIPSATRTVTECCGGMTDMEGPHVHLVGFATASAEQPEYEIVIGENIARHIIELMRVQGAKL